MSEKKRSRDDKALLKIALGDAGFFALKKRGSWNVKKKRKSFLAWLVIGKEVISRRVLWYQPMHSSFNFRDSRKKRIRNRLEGKISSCVMCLRAKGTLCSCEERKSLWWPRNWVKKSTREKLREETWNKGRHSYTPV